MDLLRIDAVIGGPVYIPADRLHAFMPHPSASDHTIVTWGPDGESQCTVAMDADEFAQALERSSNNISLRRVAV